MGITYQLTGLPDNATSEQITTAFREQYPNVPLMAGIRAADYDKAKIWQYSGTAWIQLTSININTATSTSLGVVKGSVTSDTNEGKIFVEVDGSMTVIGWDTLKALATAAKQSVDNLEPRVTQQSAKIEALEGNVAGNASDISTLEGTSADHESRITSLETTSTNLGTRMSSAETDIDNLQTSDAQQTSKISSLETTSANHGSKISALEKTSENQGKKITSLETTSTNQGNKITTLEGSSADHESRISSLETTSSDLRTRMSSAETDIDALQASDAQQTSKISALESDMNNVKPRVGQLESDVGTLETKVDQHTQSISGLSTEVNGLKTSKQDKLIAGTGISIASDGKTISVEGAVEPQRIAINTYDQLRNAINNMNVGDRLTGDAIAKTGNSGSAAGLAFFDFEKITDMFTAPSSPTTAVFRRHRCSVLIGNLPQYKTAQEGSTLGDTFNVNLHTSQITFAGGCAFTITDGKIVFKNTIATANPNVSFTSSGSLAFINVYWLKY